MTLKKRKKRKPLSAVSAAERKKTVAGVRLSKRAESARLKHLVLKVKSGEMLSHFELAELKRLELPPGSEIVYTQRQLAHAMGVSTRTVRNWIRSGLPRNPDGGFHIGVVGQWRSLRDSGNGKAGPEKNWDAEFRQYRAKLAELEFQEKIGGLLPRLEVEKGRARRIMVLKKQLLALPRRVAPHLVGLNYRECQVLLDQRIREMITAFAEGLDWENEEFGKEIEPSKKSEETE